MRWACGLTTVPSRRDVLLPKTLASLKSAGFTDIRLFVDGCSNKVAVDYERQFELPVTARNPAIRVSANTIMSLAELYVRFPLADRYAMFQDDFVTYVNLRLYLEKCKLEPKTYWNLYTFPSNQQLAPKHFGWYKSRQTGRGAVALMFDRDGIQTLLSNREHIVDRPTHVEGWRKIDGGIVCALKKAGYHEMVHNPSLVQHTGVVSTSGNDPHRLATSFRGVKFDALSLLEPDVS